MSFPSLLIIIPLFAMQPFGLRTLAAPMLWCCGCCILILLSLRGCVLADDGCCCEVELGTCKAGSPELAPLTMSRCCCFYELYERRDRPTNVGPLAKSFLGMLCSLAFSFCEGYPLWALFIGRRFFKLCSDWLLPCAFGPN